jgi:uncharacterized protein
MKLYYIFFNREYQLRSWWRLLVFLLIFFVGIAALSELLNLLLNLITGTRGALVSYMESPPGLVTGALMVLTVSTLTGWVCGLILEGIPFRSMGWSPQKSLLKDLINGSLSGAATLLLTVIIAAMMGAFQIRLASGTGGILATLVLTLPVFIIAAASEESLFRGYPLQTLLRGNPVWLSIIPSSALFALAHLKNPHAQGLTLFNTFLAGVWLTAGYLSARNLWYPLGMHWAWNWCQGAVLGLPVSGITTLTPNPLLISRESGPDWFTGGPYGLEGGLGCTIGLVISTALIYRRRSSDTENPGTVDESPTDPGISEE